MNALEAREIAEAYNNNIELIQLDILLNEIKDYAKEGEFGYWVFKEMTTLTKDMLKGLGFSITETINDNKIEYQITW